MPKFLIYLLLFLLIIIVYLNRSYAYFYDYIGSHTFERPDLMQKYQFNNSAKTGQIKIVSLGDSLTAGVGTKSPKDSYIYQVSEDYSKDYHQVDLINLAVPGAVSLDVLKTQLPEALKENPDLVYLEVGTNDVHNFVSEKYFANNFQEIVTSLKKTKAKIKILNIPFIGHKSILLPPHNYLLNERIKQFNKEINIICQKNNLACFDLYSQTYPKFYEDSSVYSEDLFHPNKKGYTLWKEFLDKQDAN